MHSGFKYVVDEVVKCHPFSHQAPEDIGKSANYRIDVLAGKPIRQGLVLLRVLVHAHDLSLKPC
jgi:hypothetical protein